MSLQPSVLDTDTQLHLESPEVQAQALASTISAITSYVAGRVHPHGCTYRTDPKQTLSEFLTRPRRAKRIPLDVTGTASVEMAYMASHKPLSSVSIDIHDIEGRVICTIHHGRSVRFGDIVTSCGIYSDETDSHGEFLRTRPHLTFETCVAASEDPSAPVTVHHHRRGDLTELDLPVGSLELTFRQLLEKIARCVYPADPDKGLPLSLPPDIQFALESTFGAFVRTENDFTSLPMLAAEGPLDRFPGILTELRYVFGSDLNLSAISDKGVLLGTLLLGYAIRYPLVFMEYKKVVRKYPYEYTFAERYWHDRYHSCCNGLELMITAGIDQKTIDRAHEVFLHYKNTGQLLRA